jgi:hypothetical protein
MEYKKKLIDSAVQGVDPSKITKSRNFCISDDCEDKQTCVSMHINLFKDLNDSQIPDIDIENEELKQISVNDVEKAQRYLRLKAIKYEKYILS